MLGSAIRQIFGAIVLVAFLLVGSGGLVSSPAHAQTVNTQIDEQVEQVSNELTRMLRVTSAAMTVLPSGEITFNAELLRKNGANESELKEVQSFVDKVNSRPPYKVRSWAEYGKCFVLTVTGLDIATDVGAELDWNAIGKAIKEKDWGKAASIIKNGVQKFIKKKGPKALAKKGVKELLGLSPWGLAAKAVYAAGYCAL